MTADFGADALDAFQRLLDAEQVVERLGIEIRVSELCPPGKMYVMNPAALELSDDPARKVLVVPTEALAEQVRAAAAQAGVPILDGD